MTRRFIPVAEPVLAGNEKKYVNECLESGWISGSGNYVEAFEKSFADFCGVRHAVSIVNGTAALHVALLALGIGRGDEVIVPDLTFIASANAVTYCGAQPVFADVDARTWTLDPQDTAAKISARTKAVMPVHLYGHPANMTPLLELAQDHDIHVIEDAAEAHGAEYKGQRVGSIGDIAAFSFFGNKVVTTGEGGMITTNDAQLADQARLLKGQGMDPERRYHFPIVGYNYRMTNLQAAIGVAQMERIDWFIERRREVAAWYDNALKNLPVTTMMEASWAKSVYWLYSICIPEEIDRDLLMTRMLERGIETRPFFYPTHRQPPYRLNAENQTFPVTTKLSAQGLSLPSSARISKEEVAYITDALGVCLQAAAKS
ncbi:MAG: DegT/DnrJ/EryC1/StrS family aminotransferase [Pyrinomonadaceae bacterium]